MTAFPALLKNSRGQSFHIAKQLGKGGEGAVYEINEQKDVAIKLYWPAKAAERRDKVIAMASAGWSQANSFVAFPIDALFSPKGDFVGFVMKKIGGKPIHLLFSPASRKVEFNEASFRFLIRAARNIARAVASVHQTGCVIGDINHSGFLTSDQATSVIIDSDSFQVSTPKQKFLCQVGTPEYTPPELQGSRFDRTARIANHDAFGLAVLIFQLLFMGRHPFSGRFLGSGEMPLERAIGECRFAYSSLSGTQMQPPPGAPLLSDFPDYIAKAFETAFGRHTSSGRPPAAEWNALLEKLENEIQQCSKDSSHQHVKGKPCPWCRMERVFPGFIAFSPAGTLSAIPIHIDVAQIRVIINSIRDPGPALNLQSLVTAPVNLSPGSVGQLAGQLKKRAYLGIAGSVGGALLIFAGGIGVALGLSALGAGLLANIVVPSGLKKLRDAKVQANASWRSIQDIWNKQDGHQKFKDLQIQADNLIQELAEIPAQERKGVQELEQKKHNGQLARHLDRFLIANSKIKKIGSGRKVVLASWGVQTAADVSPTQIGQIPGFGPTLIAELMAWKQTCVNKFVFNPSEPVNASDLAALKTRLGNRKAELETKIRSAATALQHQSTSTLEQRKKIVAGANQTYGALRQAEVDENSVGGSFERTAKVTSLCFAALAAIGLLMPSSPPSSSVAPLSARNDKVVIPPAASARLPGSLERKEPARGNPTGSPSSSSSNRTASAANDARAPSLSDRTPSPAASEPTRSSSSAERNVSTKSPADRQPDAPASVKLPSQTFPPNNSPVVGPTEQTAAPSDQMASRSNREPYSAPPLPPPISVPSVPGGPLTQENKKLDLAGEATKVQQRLIELGYLQGEADGKWGPRSKRALQEFRADQSLGSDDVWDEATQRALFAASQTSLAFVGRWTPEPGVCGESTGAAPLTLSPRAAKASAGGSCVFNTFRQESATAWRVTARCLVNGTLSDADFRLSLNAATLKWQSAKQNETYYRCQ